MSAVLHKLLDQGDLEALGREIEKAKTGMLSYSSMADSIAKQATRNLTSCQTPSSLI